MRITLVGPGRAGTALALAARAAGHDIVAVLARRPEAAAEAGARLGGSRTSALDGGLPESDLAVIATRDDAIETVASRLAAGAVGAEAIVHLSGLTSVTALGPLAQRGAAIGSFHPLQTLPTPDVGAERLPGAWIAVTTSNALLRERLHAFAVSLAAHPFDLADEAKPSYHAAAAAAANFPLAALGMAADLFRSAGVPFEAARPLVEAVVANAFELGPREALTGPVARGDVGTVEEQMWAVAEAAPEWLQGFRVFVGELARISNRSDEFRAIVDPEARRWR